MTKKILGYGLLAGLAMIITNVIINFIISAIYPASKAIYENTETFRAMNDPMMLLFWLYPLVLGIVFAWTWNRTKILFTKGNSCTKGFYFGLIYFCVSAIPALLINIGSFNLEVWIPLSWTLLSFANGWIAGWTLAKLNK